MRSREKTLAVLKGYRPDVEDWSHSDVLTVASWLVPAERRAVLRDLLDKLAAGSPESTERIIQDLIDGQED